MTERPRFFDDLAGVAGGAFSALTGMREEVESNLRARVEETIRRLDLVKREDLEAVQEMAARARAGQEAAEARLAALENRVSRLSMQASGNTPPADPAVSGTEAPPAAMPSAAGDAGMPNPEPPTA